MTARPSLLLLSQNLPYPPDAGVTIRTFNILRELAIEFDVTALCFHRPALGEDRTAKEEALQRWSRTASFSIPQSQSRIRLAWDHLRSALTGEVYTRFVYESSEFLRAVEEAKRSRTFQLAQLETLDLARYFEALEPLPTTCVHHNIESDLLRRLATYEWGPRRMYLAHQATLMAREEQRLCGHFALNIAVSDADSRRLSEIAPTARTLVIPNGVDVDFFRPAGAPQNGVVFTGGTIWFPNRDALEFFSQDIWPKIRTKDPDASVNWVGRATDADKKKHESIPGFVVTGYVPDVRPYVHRAACVVVPLRVGGGTRLKILDAWAMGKAVVSTSVGCEGLSAVDEENILVRDEPEDFAEAVCELLGDAERRQRLGRAARETVEREYSWSALGKRIRAAYQDLLVGG